MADYWDEVAVFWVKNRPDRLWRAYSDALYTALFTAWLPADRRVRLLKTDLFDEASGPGLAKMLAEKSCPWLGMDIAFNVVRPSASGHPLLKGFACDVRRLALADDSLEVILSNSTLDHFVTIAEIRQSLEECFRVLAPGGELLITLDNPLNPVIAVRNALPYRWLNRAGLIPYQMGKTCSPRLFQRCLKNAGFDILEMKSSLHFPRILAVWLARLVIHEENARRWFRFWAAFEALDRLPTRYLSGYYLAARARKPIH